MKEVIMKVPSFSADYPKAPIYVAELVRCGECIYWKNSLCQAWHRVIPKDGYCSIGERDRSTQTETQNSNLTFEKADERCKGCNHYKLTCDLFSEICRYEPKDEPQTDDAYFLELMGAVERGEISDAGANQAWYEYINHKDESQERSE